MIHTDSVSRGLRFTRFYQRFVFTWCMMFTTSQLKEMTSDCSNDLFCSAESYLFSLKKPKTVSLQKEMVGDEILGDFQNKSHEWHEIKWHKKCKCYRLHISSWVIEIDGSQKLLNTCLTHFRTHCLKTVFLCCCTLPCQTLIDETETETPTNVSTLKYMSYSIYTVCLQLLLYTTYSTGSAVM